MIDDELTIKWNDVKPAPEELLGLFLFLIYPSIQGLGATRV